MIEKVTKPTDWVSPIVIQTKRDSEEIRLCVDMRQANRAIKRTRYVIPTIDEIRHKLNGAKWFSKVDLRNGYHQLELEEKSRDITTFTTHVGLFRYKRLNFGTCSASELFHEEIRKKVSDIIGVLNVHDDILVFSESKQNHDAILNKLLTRLNDLNVTANKDKCIFGVNTIGFFGLN